LFVIFIIVGENFLFKQISYSFGGSKNKIFIVAFEKYQ
jgi:hypothetical protein